MSHRWKRLRRATVTNPGEKYQEKPAITVSEPAAPKEPAAVTPVMDGDGIASIAVDSGGNFYNTPPTVTISPPDQLSGTQATAAAVLQNFEVSSINVTDSGSGYTSPPTVTVAKSTDPKSDFTAKLSVDFDSSTGTVTKINVVDSGNFYDENNPPTITIEKPFPNQEFEVGEDVNISGIGADSTAATMTGEVAEFIEATGKLVIIHVANDTGDFVEPGPNSVVTAPASGASSIITKSENPEIPGDASDEFDDEASDFLDFSESNPFGEPEAATVAQEAAAIATQTSTPTEAVIQGTKSDPSFDYPLEYKVVANGVTYQYNASGEDERNYFEGIRDLNIPGLTIGSYNATGIVNGIEVKYTPQVDGDTVKFAGSGWIHLGILEGEYGVSGDRQDLSSGDSAAPQPDIEVFGAKNDPSFASGKTYTLTANGILYSYGPTDAPGDPYNGSFYAGLRSLDIPGFTITVHDENGFFNAVKLEYIKQTPTDTLILDPNANGWEHLEIIPGTYDGVTTPSQGQGQGQGAGQGQQGGGQTTDTGFMSDSDYSTRVAQSSTSSVFDSAAVNLGLEKIRFESKYHWTTSDVTGSLYMPRGVTFGDNGRKLFYVSGGAYQNTQYVYGMKMSTPYDVSSINHAESAASLNLSTHFSDIFQGGYSGQYSEHNMLDVWFNPQGTKMWVSGNTYSVVAQFALDSAWNLNGTITPEHKIGTGSLNMWSNGSVRLNNWTYDSNLQVINNYSNEWIDSGRTLISTGLSSRGDTIKQTFSTPYDISTCTSSGYNPNTIYRHTQYSDSDSDGAEYASDALRLAFNAGSVFNHDGSEMYFIHQQFDSANFNESGGSGLGGWRVNLVKATLDTPYDITTMAFERQAEITNLAESAGGPTHVKPSGKMAIHPAGNRFYMMTYASEIAGTPNYSHFNLWEFSTQPDSAGSPAITTPDISVKPMIQGTYTPTQPATAPYQLPPPENSLDWTISNISRYYDSDSDGRAEYRLLYEQPDKLSYQVSGAHRFLPDAQFGSGERVNMEWADSGKMLYVGNRHQVGMNRFYLSQPYDITTAVRDSVDYFRQNINAGNRQSEYYPTYQSINHYAHVQGDGMGRFNKDGTKITWFKDNKGYTYDLDSAWDLFNPTLSTLSTTTILDIGTTSKANQWVSDVTSVTANNNIPIQSIDYGLFGLSDGNMRYLDSGTKVGFNGGTHNDMMVIYNVPTAYDLSSITWHGTGHDIFSAANLQADYTWFRSGNKIVSDFEFSTDGKTLWTATYSGTEIYEYKLNTPYDLGSIDSDTVKVMDDTGFEAYNQNTGYVQSAAQYWKNISVTPNGMLYLGMSWYYDSNGSGQEELTGGGPSIVGHDLTVNRYPTAPATVSNFDISSLNSMQVEGLDNEPNSWTHFPTANSMWFDSTGNTMYLGAYMNEMMTLDLATPYSLNGLDTDFSNSFGNNVYPWPQSGYTDMLSVNFDSTGTKFLTSANNTTHKGLSEFTLTTPYDLNTVTGGPTATYTAGFNWPNNSLNNSWTNIKETEWATNFWMSGRDFITRWTDGGTKVAILVGGQRQTNNGLLMILPVTTPYDMTTIQTYSPLSAYDFEYEMEQLDVDRFGAKIYHTRYWSDFEFSQDGTKFWLLYKRRLPAVDGQSGGPYTWYNDLITFTLSTPFTFSRGNVTLSHIRKMGVDADTSIGDYPLSDIDFYAMKVVESQNKIYFAVNNLLDANGNRVYEHYVDIGIGQGYQYYNTSSIIELDAGYSSSGSSTDSSAPPAYPQQRIQNLAYDSTQELSWSTVSNEYGLEVSPDGSTIVMKDLGQNDWRVFTMSTPYDLSTAIRDTTKEPTFGMSDSAHKFKSHGMTFTSDWSKLATTRIGTPLDIYKNEISMYDITGGNSTYSLDRIDNESDGDRTSFWGTLAFEAQITDQDGTNHNQRPDNIQFGDSGQRLYWTNLNGTTNLMSQWHLSSPNTIDLDMVDSGGLYISSITGDSDTLSAAINHDGKRVYVLTNTAYQSRGIGIYQLDLDSAWNVKTATWNSDNFLKISNNNDHGNVTSALGDIAVCEDYLFVSLTSDGSTVIRRYKIEDSTPPPPPPPTSNSDSDGLGYATAANWIITVDEGPLYEDSATQGNVFFGEAVASTSDLTFGYPPSTANRTWSSGKIRSITSLPGYYNTYQNVSSPNDLAVGDQGNFYVLDGTTTIKQFFCADSADLTNMSYLRSFTLDGTDNLSISFKRDGSQMYTVGGTSGKIKTYDLSTSWDVSTAVQDTNKTFTVPDDNNPRDFIMSPWGNGMIVLGGQNNTIYQYALDSESYDPSTAGTSYANLDIGAVTNVNGQLGISPDATKIKASHFSSYNMYIFGQDHFATIKDYIYQGTVSWPGLWRKYDQANSTTSIADFRFGTLPENEEDFSDAKGFDFSFTGRTIYSIYDDNFKGLYLHKMDWPNMTFGTE